MYPSMSWQALLLKFQVYSIQALTAVYSSSNVQLGQSNLQVSQIGIGTLQWGDPDQGYGKNFNEDELQQVFDCAIAGGINFFDTAEVYGYQSIKSQKSSEHLLGSFVADLPASTDNAVVVGTKFFTIPWTNVLVGGGFRLGKGSILEALTGSLGKLAEVDLYQVHFPFPTFPQQVLADALTEIVEKGLVRSVGVCNYDIKGLRELHGILEKRGIPLASNQVKCSVLERGPLKTGLLQACADLGITLVAHSPLSQGKLSGRYLEGGTGSKTERLLPLLKLMQFIGALYGGRSVSQVALNYLVAQGMIPIPGAKYLRHAKDHVQALEWDLEDNEVQMINEKADSLKL